MNIKEQFELLNKYEYKLNDVMLDSSVGHSDDQRVSLIEQYMNALDFLCFYNLKWYRYISRKNFIDMYGEYIVSVWTSFRDYTKDEPYLNAFYFKYLADGKIMKYLRKY